MEHPHPKPTTVLHNLYDAGDVYLFMITQGLIHIECLLRVLKTHIQINHQHNNVLVAI